MSSKKAELKKKGVKPNRISSLPDPKYFLVIVLIVVVGGLIVFRPDAGPEKSSSLQVWLESDRLAYFERCTNPPPEIAQQAEGLVKDSFGIDLDIPGGSHGYCGCMLDELQEEFPNRQDYTYTGDEERDADIAQRTGRVIARCHIKGHEYR